MDGLQAPWRFELLTDFSTLVGCCVVLSTASAIVLYMVCLNLYRAKSTQALQVKKIRQQGPAQPLRAEATVADSRAEGLGAPSGDLRRYYKGHMEDKIECINMADDFIHNELKWGMPALRLALQAPYSCLKHLSEHLRLPCSGVWLLPLMLVAELVAVGLCALRVPTSASAAAWMLCTPIGVVVGMMLRCGSKLDASYEFVHIDNFEEHRSIKAPTSENIIKMASIIYVFFASASLATSLLPVVEEGPEVKLTDYDKVRNIVSRIFGMAGFVRIPTGLLSDAACVSIVFLVSAGVVLLWVVVYHPLIHLVMDQAGKETTDKWTKRPEHVCVRMHLYEHVGQKTCFRKAFLFLSDTAFLPVVTNLLKMLSCTYDNSDGGHLHGAPGVTCWTLPHTAMALTATLCFFAYVPTVVFGASFMLADSDGKIASPSLDVLFESRYLVLQTLMKVLLSIASVFVGPVSAPWSLSMQFVINLSLTVATIVMKPCSILWVNYLNASSFSCTTLASIMAFYSVATNAEWWPLLIFLLGFMAIGATLVRTLVTLRRIGGYPKFSLSAALGASHPDTLEFDDGSRLRGSVHRLRQITFWVEGPHRLKGLQCIFEVDGVVVFGAPHKPSGDHPGWSEENFVLEPGEEILEASACWDTQECFLRLMLRTNKKERRFGWSEGAPFNFQEFKQEPGKVVVALHGGLGGDIHNLGFISVNRPPGRKRHNGKGGNPKDDTEDGAIRTEAQDSAEGLANETECKEEQDGGGAEAEEQDGGGAEAEAATIGLPACSESASPEHTGGRKAKKKKQGSGAAATSTPAKKRTKRRSSKGLGLEGVASQKQGQAGERKAQSRSFQPADTPEV